MTLKPSREEKPTCPTGTVTLLFTDIAGSSRLWEQHGDRFIPVWQAHDSILRDALARFGGYEVKSEGDSLMIAFSDASSALRCALFAQAALARYPWPPDIGQPRVRMGLHTGTPFVHGNDYFGPAVNRAAHICASANPGQVLLSDATRSAIGDRIDPEVTFTDLGDWRLKDLGTPQRLLQAAHPSVEPKAFPPPRTLEGQPNNLPVQRTSFVGRAKEIDEVAAYLARGETPVLTLIGPGGVGKTRLSLQAAAAKAEWFPDGVWYVPMAEAQDVVGAAVEVAAAMKIPLDPELPALPQVRAWLANRSCLLILDDIGTVPHADRLIRELLSGTTGLRCLATARESLQIAESATLPLSGLPTEIETTDADMHAALPEGGAMEAMDVATGVPARAPGSALTETDAGRLFLERAAAANPHLKLSRKEQAAAEELLRDLEGMPVSIERAAQLMNRLPPSAVLEWLNQKLAPDRVAPASQGEAATGVEKFKGIMRRGAQKVYATLEETTKTSVVSFGQLLQGIADVATDRKNEERAAELGRETLRLSQQAGDELGMAAALRQLARIKWQQHDRQSAVAMLAAAVALYRRHNAEEYAAAQAELEILRDQLDHPEQQAPVSLDHAVTLALQDAPSA